MCALCKNKFTSESYNISATNARKTCNDSYKMTLYTAGMESMGKRIERLLEAKNGGNRSEFARFVGVSPQAVQQWVTNKTSPRNKHLDRSAEFLGVQPAVLRFGNAVLASATSVMKFDKEKDTAKATRTARLALWCADKAVPKAEKSYFSQLMGGKVPFGEKAARRIEMEYGMEKGWLDRPMESTDLPAMSGDAIQIEEYDVSFAMGGGQAPSGEPEVVHIWQVTPEWLRLFLPKFRGNHNTLKIAKGFGDCLSTRYENGDMLLIDISHRGQILRSDGMYAFRWDGLLYIKELRPLGQRRAAAHDKDGKAFDINYASDDFEVIAKVVKAWRMER